MYKTYPYFVAGIGADTHIRFSYEIDDKELRILDRLGPTTFVQLPPTSVHIKQNLGQKLIDVGDVVVHDMSGKEPVVCQNIKKPFDFKAALYGTHPEVVSRLPGASIQDSLLEELPLNISYSICGTTFPINRMTGRFEEKIAHGAYLFARDDGGKGPTFIIPDDFDLEYDLGLELGARLTMTLFEDTSFFLLFNHTNSRWKYYPHVFVKLFHRLQRGILRDILNERTLRNEAEHFDKSETFRSAFEIVQRL